MLGIHRVAGLAFLALVTALTGGIHLQAGEPARALTESLTIGALLGVGYAFAAQIQQLQRQSAIERDLLLSRERKRTASSLHDGLGHRLTAIILGIDAALRLPAEEARRELARARGTAREALDEMRATVRAMTPLELRDGDLLRALNSVAESFSSTALRVRVVGGSQPPEPLALLALRFTQEALTNVVRHSDAGAVLIEVEASQEGLRIRAEDDGSPAEFSPGYGISSLDRRARELGGRVTASAEKGFSLLMEVPCVSS
ncbi:sensor histidine kinase [Corynebacterium mastitidis]